MNTKAERKIDDILGLIDDLLDECLWLKDDKRCDCDSCSSLRRAKSDLYEAQCRLPDPKEVAREVKKMEQLVAVLAGGGHPCDEEEGEEEDDFLATIKHPCD